MCPIKPLVVFVLHVLWVLSSAPLHAASAPDLDDRTREIASELRCVVCQNLSVADSPSEMAQQMRAMVREQLEAGKSAEQIKEFFVSKYGEWVLLKPKTAGVALLLWVLPYVALALGIVAALYFAWRWTSGKGPSQEPSRSAPASESAWLKQDFSEPDLEDDSARAELLRERLRLKDELSELEFDFQSGKLSADDYNSLKQEIETKAASIRRQIAALPPEPAARSSNEKLAAPRVSKPAEERMRFRRWQLVGGGLFLLLFGLGLGVMLTKAVRPRESSNDTMTGDFLTGTTSLSADTRAALNEGKQAFARKEFPRAIEAFKKVLAADPNNPEAHSYMGFILIEAGHADGALMAFDKALSQAPNLPMALWGKAMILYREKQDYDGARKIFEQLLITVPPGEERNEIAKVLAEIPAARSEKNQTQAAPRAGATSAPASISGTITIDPKLKSQVDSNAALFIIARAAGGPGGPPLAVRKIDKPEFPLHYTLGQENVMMQGMPFTGKINITVRLDKDGDPVTRGPGDLSGEYRKNPVEVGTKNVDITIDQASR
ncbi:MAG TPA: cytochrome c-type biogenesis protein CcmH [Methylomirabilota bacterium]|nr:cytochrome c-type biogenesis protein CcmH [Methylomirabilota bacterium]